METPGLARTPKRDVLLKVAQVSSACTFCKARKIKCDGLSPSCGGCAKFGRASTCSLAALQQTHGRDYVTHLLGRINGIRAEISSRCANSRSFPNHGTNGGDAVSENGTDLRGNSRAAAAPTGQRSMVDSLIADIGALPILASSYPGKSLGGPSLSTVLLAAASKKSIPTESEPITIGEAQSMLPGHDIAQRLAHHYMTNIYPRLPFFSIEGFWTQFNSVYSEPCFNDISADGSRVDGSREGGGLTAPVQCRHRQGYNLFTVLIVLAIATSSLSRSSDSIISSNAERLFRSALRFRESAILPNAIVGVQSVLFLIQFATLNPSSLDAWYLIGSGMRNCVDLGLHQDPKPVAACPEDQLETRRRLWWSMYSFDRSMSVACGRPAEVPDHVIDVKLPAFQIGCGATASEFEVTGYLQRYRVLRLQSLVYDMLDTSPRHDAAALVIDLRSRLEGWLDLNESLPGSRALLESEWYIGLVLLYRPCPLLPERGHDELLELWRASRAFIGIYKKLVESNSIFYVQIACEKIYWTGLAMLYAFWKLKGQDLRQRDLWKSAKDVTFVLQTLAERWEEGRSLGERFDRASVQLIESFEEYDLAARNSKSTENPGIVDFTLVPEELQAFSSYTSLTSIWTDGQARPQLEGIAGADDDLQNLVADITMSI